jgi:hypothetical protein
MPACKNCGGSNNKVVYNYTPKIYTICPAPATCADENKCNEILDAACVQYTGNNIIKCSTENVVIQYDSAEDAFIKIIDLLCERLPEPLSSLAADIVEETDDNGFPMLSAIAINGVGPYTYEWKTKNDERAPHYIEGSNTDVSVRLNCLGENGFAVELPQDTEDPLYNLKITNVYLKIIDSTNATAYAHYDYIHNCYLPVANEPIEQAYIGSAKMYFWDYGPHPITHTFHDVSKIEELPTCETIKNYICDGGEVASEYRAARDMLLKNMNENALNYSSGGRNILPPYFIPLDYSIWGMNSVGSQVYAGLQMIPKIPNIMKGCPACVYSFWNRPMPSFNNQSMAERYPVDQYPCIQLTSYPRLYETLAEYPAGQWGDILKVDSDDYMWDPIANVWSIPLYEEGIGDIHTTMRAKRDAALKALNEYVLATDVFILANDYMPLHMYKYAQIKPYYIN